MVGKTVFQKPGGKPDKLGVDTVQAVEGVFRILNPNKRPLSRDPAGLGYGTVEIVPQGHIVPHIPRGFIAFFPVKQVEVHIFR